MPFPLPRTLDLSVTNVYPPPSGIGNHFHEFIPDAGFEKPMSRELLLAHLRDRARSFVCPSIPPSLLYVGVDGFEIDDRYEPAV